MQGSPLIAHSPSSPSFNSYSSEKIADIAARVVHELANDSVDDDSHLPNILSWSTADEDCLERRFQSLNVEDNNKDQNDEAEEEEDEDENENNDEFEFAVVWRETGSSPISADEIFFNGQIRPIYPLFNTDLLSNEERELSIPHITASNQTTTSKRSERSSLGKLLDEDRGEATTITMTTNSSCSSSEADELDGVSPSTYCVWAPRKAIEDKDHQKCKKSHSTGSSKRWKLRDLVFRSNSDGKETFVFLAPPSKKSLRLLGGYRGTENNSKKRQEVKDGDKRRSFLPFRHDLLGLFTDNVDGLNKNLQPF
uniref:Uncharacterized protein MANES_06G104800 n=1 Tax=Rhizophora mucronata TaxID=61149 RepID=A0A2P2QLD1_RHIMU